MDKLARQLNAVLKGSIVDGLLSRLGRRFYFPRGVVAQTAEALQHATRHTATAGMAYENGKPLYLQVMRDLLPGLDPEEVFPYAPNPGLPKLRHLWREQLSSKNPSLASGSFSLPLVVPGVTAGISVCADLFVDRGDCVVIPDLYWGNYRLVFVERRMARLVTFPFYTGDGAYNVEAMQAAIRSQGTSQKTILLLNFPNNPTGYALDRAEVGSLLAALHELASLGHRICVILDDAYFGLFYEEQSYKESLFGPLATLHENILCVKADGATKEELAWGFRVGFLTYGSKSLSEEQYAALLSKTMGVVRSTASSTSRLSQSLLIRAIEHRHYQQEKDAVFQILKERYRIVQTLTQRPSLYLRPLPYNSGYFMCFELSEQHAEDLRLYLLHERGVGTIAVSPRHLRIAYSSVDKEALTDLFGEIYAAAGRI